MSKAPIEKPRDRSVIGRKIRELDAEIDGLTQRKLLLLEIQRELQQKPRKAKRVAVHPVPAEA